MEDLVDKLVIKNFVRVKEGLVEYFVGKLKYIMFFYNYEVDKFVEKLVIEDLARS